MTDIPGQHPAPASLKVLRPSRAAYKRAVLAILPIAVLLLVIILIRIVFNPWLIPILIVGVGVGIGARLLYYRNRRIEFGGGRYRSISLFGTVREFSAADVGTLVTVTTLLASGSVQAAPQLILIRAIGTKLLRLRGQDWDIEQFAVLADDLISHGVALDALREPITVTQLGQRYPELLGVWEAHPVALGVILGFGIVIVVVVAVVVFNITTLTG